MTGCPSGPELTRALSDGPSETLALHLSSCVTCRAHQQGLDRAIQLARQLDAPMPSSARVEEARTALLAAASMAPPASARPPRRALWLGALAAAIVVLAVTRSNDAPSRAHQHGAVHARPAARFTPVSSAPDEIITLHDGTIDVDVAPLHAGERFRVLVGDAEVEVHGTAFTVAADAGRLVSVAVTHGVVEVRTADGARRTLTAGQSWPAPTRITTAIAPAPIAAAPVAPTPIVPSPAPASPSPAKPPIVRDTAKVPAPPPPRSPPPASAPPPSPQTPRLPEALAYDDAWAAMRANRFADAASAFARVQALAPTGPLVEDAAYWYAVALARADRPAPAAAAFRAFLDAFPTSRRAGETSAMLGWILVDAGDLVEAERRFRAARHDPRPDVRASAEAGLAAVAKLPSP
jgi:TolA-binding protein